MERLAGRVAIISGGLGDIGRAIGREIARSGADIALGDVLEDVRASGLLRELRQMGRRARYDRADVADAEAVSAWIRAVEADLGAPDLIIPNAAVVTLAGIRDITPEQWAREIQVNLNGAFHLAQAGALRLLACGRPGRIVFLGSWAAHAPHAHIPAYCAAKAGLRMLCKCMALDLAPRGILVNEVAPGYVDAGLSAQVFREQPERRAQAEKAVPVRKLITPEEVAAQVAHLCDPDNCHMTGSVLLMDGGLSLVSPGGEAPPD
jgi:NAD(P)-dependent dehydrogenase (short-subunit alcohol dehydrogenase family)